MRYNVYGIGSIRQWGIYKGMGGLGDGDVKKKKRISKTN
jgi:hypothetical protein